MVPVSVVTVQEFTLSAGFGRFSFKKNVTAVMVLVSGFQY